MVGENFAVLQPDRPSTSGFATWIVWAILLVRPLPQLHNRFRMQIQWFWSYLAGQRSWRLIARAPRAVDLIEQKSVS
jgi:NADH:ubiquinone reductase (H+-translocating)